MAADPDPTAIPGRVISYGRTLARRTGIDVADGVSFAAEAWGLRENDDEALWCTIAYRRCVDGARKVTGRADRGGVRSRPLLILDMPVGDGTGDTYSDILAGREDPEYQGVEDRVDLVAIVGGLEDADLAALARSFWLRIPQKTNSPGAIATARAMRRARRVAESGGCAPVAPVAPVAPSGSGALTRRQLEMLALAAEGLTNEQIASRLSVSSNTVKSTFQNALKALGAESRTHAVALAFRAGLIS